MTKLLTDINVLAESCEYKFVVHFLSSRNLYFGTQNSCILRVTGLQGQICMNKVTFTYFSELQKQL